VLSTSYVTSVSLQKSHAIKLEVFFLEHAVYHKFQLPAWFSYHLNCSANVTSELHRRKFYSNLISHNSPANSEITFNLRPTGRVFKL